MDRPYRAHGMWSGSETPLGEAAGGGKCGLRWVGGKGIKLPKAEVVATVVDDWHALNVVVVQSDSRSTMQT